MTKRLASQFSSWHLYSLQFPKFPAKCAYFKSYATTWRPIDGATSVIQQHILQLNSYHTTNIYTSHYLPSTPRKASRAQWWLFGLTYLLRIKQYRVLSLWSIQCKHKIPGLYPSKEHCCMSSPFSVLTQNPPTVKPESIWLLFPSNKPVKELKEQRKTVCSVIAVKLSYEYEFHHSDVTETNIFLANHSS